MPALFSTEVEGLLSSFISASVSVFKVSVRVGKGG
jgi:hypothetical protein